MTLEEYIENLIEFAKENPETLSMEVIYSSDDEGNEFRYVHYTPTLGYLNEDLEFFNDGEDLEDQEIRKDDFNAVCIN